MKIFVINVLIFKNSNNNYKPFTVSLLIGNKTPLLSDNKTENLKNGKKLYFPFLWHIFHFPFYMCELSLFFLKWIFYQG